MPNLEIFFSFIFGTVIGSFLNVVIWRLPREEKLTGRSHCPKCGKTLTVLDLFPIVSFILLRAKCRHCGAKISVRYPVIELVVGLLFAAVWWLLRPETLEGYLVLVKALLVISSLVVVFMVDLEHFLILDNVLLPAGTAVLFLNAGLDLASPLGLLSAGGHLWTGFFGAIAAALPFFAAWYFSQGKWMGFGDVKLALFLGLALGWPIVGIALLVSVLLGGMFSVYLLAFRHKTLKTQVPFGTFLSLGAIVAVFWGERLLAWYLAFLGF